MKSLMLLLSSLVILFCTVIPSNAQTTALPGQSFAFDYLSADIISFSITRFEMKIDTGAYVNLAMPPVSDDAQTPIGGHSYKAAIPALTNGSHTVVFRACSATGCSADSPAFTFNLVIIKSPTGIRIVVSVP